MLHDLSLSKGKKHFDGFDEIQVTLFTYIILPHDKGKLCQRNNLAARIKQASDT